MFFFPPSPIRPSCATPPFSACAPLPSWARSPGPRPTSCSAAGSLPRVQPSSHGPCGEPSPAPSWGRSLSSPPSSSTACICPGTSPPQSAPPYSAGKRPSPLATPTSPGHSILSAASAAGGSRGRSCKTSRVSLSLHFSALSRCYSLADCRLKHSRAAAHWCRK